MGWESSGLSDILEIRSTALHCDNQYEAVLAAVVTKSGPMSICVNAASWDPYMSGVFTGDCNTTYNDMDHRVQLAGLDTAVSTL